MQQPLAFLSQADPATMQYHQAMKEPCREQFIKAIAQEVNTYTEQKHWKLIPNTQILEGFKILSVVWVMKRRRDVKTGNV
eukprot:9742984-Ditylum_brightwellii.AAC.1